MVAYNWPSKAHMEADKDYAECPSGLQAWSRMKNDSLSKIKGKTEKTDEHAGKIWCGKENREECKHQKTLINQ